MARRSLLPRLIGRVQVFLDGQKTWEGHNIYTNVGYQRLAAWLAGQAASAPAYIAVGNGNGSFDGTETALYAEVLRKPITSQSVQNLYTVRLVAVFAGNEANRTLTETGVLDAASGGNLFAHAALNIAKSGQIMNVVWQIVLPVN